MDYTQMVDGIQKVTGFSAPVYFNDAEANFTGTPYFGVGEHIYDICPEDILLNGMFEPIDFIENKHLEYYHIGLPDTILHEKDDYIFNVFKEQLHEYGISITPTKELLELFIILHEYVHAHHLFVTYKGNVDQYIKETAHESHYNAYIIRSNGWAGKEEGLRFHKMLPTEKYADAFALKHFVSVAKYLNSYL